MYTTSKAKSEYAFDWSRRGGLERLSSSDTRVRNLFSLLQRAGRRRGGDLTGCSLNILVLPAVYPGSLAVGESVCMKERQVLWSRRRVAGLHKAGLEGEVARLNPQIVGPILQASERIPRNYDHRTKTTRNTRRPVQDPASLQYSDIFILSSA